MGPAALPVALALVRAAAPATRGPQEVSLSSQCQLLKYIRRSPSFVVVCVLFGRSPPRRVFLSTICIHGAAGACATCGVWLQHPQWHCLALAPAYQGVGGFYLEPDANGRYCVAQCANCKSIEKIVALTRKAGQLGLQDILDCVEGKLQDIVEILHDNIDLCEAFVPGSEPSCATPRGATQ